MGKTLCPKTQVYSILTGICRGGERVQITLKFKTFFCYHDFFTTYNLIFINFIHQWGLMCKSAKVV